MQCVTNDDGNESGDGDNGSSDGDKLDNNSTVTEKCSI